MVGQKMLKIRWFANAPFRSIRINWEAVTAISTAASVVVSLVVLCVAVRALQYTRNQIDDFRKESQAQHLIEKVQEFDSQRYKDIRRALAEKRLNRSEDILMKLDVDNAPEEMFDELNFCNDLGILTRHGALSAYDVWGEFSYWLFPFFADSQPVIKAEQMDAPASWSNCTYLVEQVKEVDKQEDAGKQLKQQEQQIIDFYDSELQDNGTRVARRGKR